MLNKTIAEKIKEARKIARLTQLDLARKLDVKQQTISQYERGETSPDFDMLKKIADITTKPLNWFFNENEETKTTEEVNLDTINNKLDQIIHLLSGNNTNIIDFKEKKEIRYMEMPIGAGFTFAEEKIYPAGTFTIPAKGNPEYAFLASGFSMEPDILNGSLLLVRPTRFNWQNGDICIIYLRETEEMTVKQVTLEGNDRIRLIGAESENVYPLNNVQIQGVVEDVIRDPIESRRIVANIKPYKS